VNASDQVFYVIKTLVWPRQNVSYLSNYVLIKIKSFLILLKINHQIKIKKL
jgi:hypothetical protein